MKTKYYAIALAFVLLQACGEDKKKEDAIMADTVTKVNGIEARRRAAPDFKCSIPEIPGHTLGPNPACVGKPEYKP
jgi:hypothetical protein